MKLHLNPASPYGRKVKVVAHETGLFQRLAIHNLQTSAVARDLGLMADNPLGKVPVWCSTMVARSTIRA
jgi:glutathione S-transferase